MKTDLIDALDAIEKERRINKEILIEAIESSLISAYKRNFGSTANVKVNLDRETGEIRVFSSKQVVEEVEDAAVQMSLEEAQKINEYYEPGDVIEEEVTPQSFGRIAAQIAKQVVMQRIREAERGVIFEEYIEKEDEVLTAVVQRVEKNNVYVELGRTEGLLSSSDMIPGEKYSVNDRLKVYVLEVKRTNKGPQVIVSRTHPGLVKRLFEFEVPEIQDGIVQVKSIAREAGFRTKIAVYSNDDQVDPVGACVGQRGIRVENVVQELNGEKIDIIKWSQDPAEYIANALGPARVIMVHINEQEKSSKVVVPDNQLSLAIGKEGQNARLAAKLTGWKIDIKSHAQSQRTLFEAFDAGEEEPVDPYLEKFGLGAGEDDE
ncbi:MAG: transcription termination/antitermination protein NusA [Clostridiales bacterium]|nr:transcription termination/antitermination protein NusA [Clostridiales bacterium]